MISYLIIFSALFLGLFFLASFRMNLNIYLRSFCSDSEEEGRAIMITFDDGPHPEYTAEVLDILKSRDVKAIFFLIGERALKYPELVKRISAEGHMIGIHSLRHTPEFTIYSKKRVKRDIEATIKILEEISGLSVKLFRPPYGVTNPSIGKAVNDLGLMAIGWNIRSFDTVTSNDINRTKRRVLKRIKHGSILLLHDRLPNSARLLEEILDYLKENNYEARIFKKIR